MGSGHSNNSLGNTPLTLQQQQQLWLKSQSQARQLTTQLDSLEDNKYKDIRKINQLKSQVKQQLNTLHPFELATSTLPIPSQEGPQPFSGPSNQSTIPNPSTQTNVSQCSSTSNGGVCQATLTSPNGQYKLVGQTDGNLVIYDSAGTAKWSSGTYGKGVAPYVLTLQSTGNLQWSDSAGTIIWSTNTGGKGKFPYVVRMQDNGNVALVDEDNKVVWNSK